ncbi:MAG: GIY-YIG nuclease family protein [Candidatus Helarchaeota archaeon]
MKIKGIYLLVINVIKDVKISIGALGTFTFKKGNHVYVGSAQNGIETRINYHCRVKEKHHWHVDYLLSNKNVFITEAFYKKAPKQEECNTARWLAREAKEIPKFGCSDCTCSSHLFFVGDELPREKLKKSGFSPFKVKIRENNDEIQKI